MLVCVKHKVRILIINVENKPTNMFVYVVKVREVAVAATGVDRCVATPALPALRAVPRPPRQSTARPS